MRDPINHVDSIAGVLVIALCIYVGLIVLAGQ